MTKDETLESGLEHIGLLGPEAAALFDIGNALRETLQVTHESDCDLEPDNVVHGLFETARAIYALSVAQLLTATAGTTDLLTLKQKRELIKNCFPVD